MTVGWVDPALQGVLHGSLALLFARSAWHKARHPGDFRRALADYALLPAGTLRAATVVLPGAEALAALALVWPGLGALPAALGGALLASYTAAMVWVWLSGRRDLDCGCGPPGVVQPVGPALLARNAVLMAGLWATLPVAGARSLGPLDVLQVGFAIAALALVYAAAEQARSNAHRLRRPPAAAGRASDLAAHERSLA